MSSADRMRVAWVVHQYGPEVPGGAETLCRKVVRLLARDIDSIVLTTRSRRYDGWEPFYEAGAGEDGGVPVIRFTSEPTPDAEAVQQLYLDAHAHPDDLERGRRWIEANGPSVPDLAAHLRERPDEYDVLCALPYVFPTTLDALEAFDRPRVLVPCAHDEPAFQLELYRHVFTLPDALVFNTDEERELVEARFGADARPNATIGLWVDPPPEVDPDAFRRRHSIEGPYVVTLGRIDPSKAADRLFALHEAALGRTPEHTLVLIGEAFMPIPDLPRLRVTGFVEEHEKHEALAGATAVVCPSPHESLSIAALEAWSHGRPVLVNAESPALLGQCRRSHGGLWFSDEREYAAALTLLLERESLAAGLGYAGRIWMNTTYDPERMRQAWLSILDQSISAATSRQA